MANKGGISRRKFIGTAAAASTALTLNPGFALAGSSGHAGNEKSAAEPPAAAATGLSGDPYPSVPIPDFKIADGPFKKNGNLLLNVPLPGNGAMDDAAVSVLEDIGRWLDINGEAIYGSRPWKQFGEEQIRFTTKPGAIYASTLGVPTAGVKIKSLAGEKIAGVRLLGSDQKIEWQQTADALVIKPVSNWPCPHAVAFKIDLIQ